MTAEDMVRELHARGVHVLVRGEKVLLRGPAHMITDEIHIVAGTFRDELRALVEDVRERTAILLFDAWMDPEEAEAVAWAEALAPVPRVRVRACADGERP